MKTITVFSSFRRITFFGKTFSRKRLCSLLAALSMVATGSSVQALTIILDFNDPVQANSTDIIGNEVSNWDPTDFGHVEGDRAMIQSWILALVRSHYYDIVTDNINGGSPIPQGFQLDIDFEIGNVGTAPANGDSEYFYVQIGDYVLGPGDGFGQARLSAIRDSGGSGPNNGASNTSIVGSIYPDHISGIIATDGPTPGGGNLSETMNLIGGTTSHEMGHALSLSHLNVAGSVNPNGLPPLMGTGAIDLPNVDRFFYREFSFSGVDGEDGNSAQSHIQQLVNAIGLRAITASSGLQYWDGANTGGGTQGGAGTWDNTTANWTNPAGSANAAWTGTMAVFSAATGNVVLGDNISFEGINFTVGTGATAYEITSGGAFSLSPNGAASIIPEANVQAFIRAAITGSGSIIKTGAGLLALSGNNTYTGATTVNNGTLLINGNQSAASGLVTVNDGGTLGGSGTIGGAVTINSGGRLAAGNSPGALTMGTLFLDPGSTTDFEFGAANAPGNALNDVINVNGDLTLDGTLNVFTSSGGTFGAGLYRMFTFTGTLTNNGFTFGSTPTASSNLYVQYSVPSQINLINKAGLTLNFWDGTNPLNYNNGTIDGGTGTWQLNPPNDNWTDINGTVNVPHDNGQFSIFQGTGGVVTVDNTNGNVTFGGAQFAVNGYTISGGTLTASSVITLMRVGDGTSAGVAYTATINSVIAGTTTLGKTDLGTLILTAANTYTNGTGISGGVLVVSADNNLGALAGSITFDDNAVLRYAAGFNSARSIALETGGGGVIDTNGFNAGLSGVISGAGTFQKKGAGVLSLSGVNTYTGETHVVGGTLALVTTGSLDANAKILVTTAGALKFYDNTSAQQALINNSDFALGEGITEFHDNSTAASAEIINNVGVVSFFDTSHAASSVIENGDVLGFYDNSSVESATITNYTGSRVEFLDSVTGTNASTILSYAGSEMDISGLVVGGIVLGQVQGGGDIYLGSKELVIGGQNVGALISGIVQDGGSFGGVGGSLTKTGTSDLLLNGTNTYSGGTTLNSGGLITDNVSALGTGPLTLNSGVLYPLSNLKVDSLLWNDGDVRLPLGPNPRLAVVNNLTNGGGAQSFRLDYNLTPLSQVNTLITFGGVTNFTGADFTGSGLPMIPNVILEHEFRVVPNAVQLVFTKATAWGPLLQNSAPILIPTFADFIVQGEVTTGRTDENNLIKSLDFDHLSTLLVYQNLGVTDGDFMVEDGSATLAGGNVLVPDVFTKSGAGTLATTATIVVNNAALIDAGALRVNGFFQSPETVIGNAGLLGGNGIILGNVTNSGYVAPGNSPGILTINGNYTQTSFGTFELEIASLSNFDVLNVGEQASLAGLLEVRSLDFKLRYGHQVAFLNAGGIIGTFDAISVPNPSDFRGRFIAEGSTGILLLAPASYTKVAQTPNQRRVAKALDEWIGEEEGDIGTVTLALDVLDERDYPQAFEAIMPSFYEAAMSTGIELSHSHGQLLHQQLSSRRLGKRSLGTPSASQLEVPSSSGKGVKSVKNVEPVIATVSEDYRWNTWIQGSGLFSSGGLSLAPGEDFESGTIMVGADYAVNEHFALGFFASYQEGWGDYDNGASIDMNAVRFGIYATVDYGGFYANAAIGAGSSSYDVKRRLNWAALDRTADGEPDGSEYFALLGTGYDFEVGNWTFGPQISAQYTRLKLDGFTERGAGSLNLRVDDIEAESLRSYIGGRVAYTWKVNDEVAIIPEFRLFWKHEFLDGSENLRANLDAGNGPGFDYETSTPQRDAIYAGVGVGFQIGPRFYGNVYYNADFSRNEDVNHTVSISASWKF